MSSVKPLQHNGVTTEVLACAVGRIALSAHNAHLHRPGTQTEYFTCPGGVKCEVCAKVVWRDEMVAHIQSEHLKPTGPRRDPSADAMAATWSDSNPPARIMCPESAVEPNKRQCSFKSDADLYAVRRHLWLAHGWSVKQVAEYLADPWLSDEPRAAWKDRIFARKYGLDETTLPGPSGECTHPNGFGPHGCAACGEFGPIDDVEVSAETIATPTPLDFHGWWSALVDESAPTIQRKAAEYGSNSLAEMGRMFARAQGRAPIDDHEALEIGCMVYAKGKIERVLDAMLKGSLPSTDTWLDTMIYAAMAQFIRQHKRWP